MTTIPATRSLLAPYELNEPGIKKQHWHRPDETLILSDSLAYYSLCTLYLAGWKPLGTDAPAFRPQGDPWDTTLTAVGVYFPALGQEVSDDDARAVAHCRPNAIELLKGVSPPHAGPSVLDDHLITRLSARGAPVFVLGPAKALEIDKPGGALAVIAHFASRGRFTINPGLPPRAW